MCCAILIHRKVYVYLYSGRKKILFVTIYDDDRLYDGCEKGLQLFGHGTGEAL